MRVLILGLGQYPQGSGVSAALFFAKRGNEVLVTDQKKEEELQKNVQQLRRYQNVSFVFGEHRAEDIRWADMIIRNPRVRPTSPEMILARQLGKQIESDVSVFFQICPCSIIGITGTRGKSTTSTLVAEMLKRSKKRVWLGGNILVSPLTFASKVTKKDLVVLELSSWLLETTGSKSISPQYAVVTNLMRDHLNTYESMEDYAEAKAQIFRHQGPDGVVVLNADDDYGKEWITEASGNVLAFGSRGKNLDGIVSEDELSWKDPSTGEKEVLLSRKKLKLLGDHNAKNVLAAALVARAAGASVSAIRSVAASFKGVPDRLEHLAVIRGIRFVNDTTSTTPDATIAAIKALAPVSKRIHLLAGGADKDLLFDELAQELKKRNVSVTLFEGTAFELFSTALKKANVGFEKMTSMEDAMKFHLANAKKGDTILLSPGCASFGLFKNEFERGEQFKKVVRGLKRR